MIFKGDCAAAVHWAGRASVIPDCQYWTGAHKAVALAHLRRVDTARETVRQLLAEKPDFSRANSRLKPFYLRDPRQLALCLASL
jgi:hypothetical protein